MRHLVSRRAAWERGGDDSGVVDLRGLDVSEGALTAERLAEAPAVRQLVDLVKVLAASESPARPRLVVVTAGVHVVAGDAGPVASSRPRSGAPGRSSPPSIPISAVPAWI